jgi:hypothetical protein
MNWRAVKYSAAVSSVDLPEQPRHLPPRLRIHRQHVDDVSPVVASVIAVAEQLRGDCVAVGLVVDQGAAERFSGLGIERFEQSA